MVEDRLGRYVVLRKLAAGGMAEVLLARTLGIEGFERHVVLKRIRRDHAHDERFIAMFLDEARLAATLHHQNIVQVFDIGEEGGDYFFAMEYIHGEDLRGVIDAMSRARANVPIGHVIAIGAAAAAGLHYAHERRDSNRKPLGIVHRDVSPSNIIVGYDGAVKLVDFGISRAAVKTAGKVAYMSPEQCRQGTVDRRSDVYSLGVVLYELATASRLFSGDDAQVVDAIVSGRAPLPQIHRPDLPSELSTILMKAISVDPARRFQNAGELREALDQFAARAGVVVSASVLGDYMRKTFGDAPEPWLDGAAGRRSGRHSGSVRLMTSGLRSRPTTASPSRTTSKLGWETPTAPPPQRSWSVARIGALLTIPLLAIVVFLVRELVKSDEPADRRAASTAGPLTTAPDDHPAEPPPVAPPPAKPDEPTPTAPETPAADKPKPATTSAHRHAPTTTTTAPPRADPGVTPEPTHPAIDSPADPGVAVSVPVDAPPAPPPIDTNPSQLSSGVVEAVAAAHARELAKCESSDTLHGDITIRFMVDASGKVIKSQVSSSLHKPLIEACFLRSLQHWKFPAQAGPGVTGVYNLSFQ
jgi:serine/threonine-protein kinase